MARFRKDQNEQESDALRDAREATKDDLGDRNDYTRDDFASAVVVADSDQPDLNVQLDANGNPMIDENATAAEQPVTPPVVDNDPESQASSLNALIIEAQVVDALETVFDPEIPVNIYELGLIYGVDVQPNGNVLVTMTLTAPSCPAAQTLPVEVEQKVRAIKGVNDVKVEITFDPPWSMEKMSDAARLQLGFM
jgi:FeS assembly SUF system protein